MMKILDIGCGIEKQDDSIGIDINPRSNADVIHDLNIFPYPFENNLFDVIYCTSVIEHLDNVIKVLEEIYRIGKNGAVVKITVPFYKNWVAFTDPTHIHFFTSSSFDYFDKTKLLSKYKYSSINFKIINVEYKKNISGKLKFWDKFWLSFANKNKYLFEERFTPFFVPEDIYFELIVDKTIKLNE